MHYFLNLFHFHLAREEISHPSTATNGESQRRPMNTTRQHLNETIRRLAKPKSNPMTQSIHIGATTGPGSSNGMPLSRSSHQLRLTTSTTATNTRKVCSYIQCQN